MAWAENSVTKMLSDGGPDATYNGDGNWTGHYKNITLTVSTSGEYAKYTISTYANSETYISVYLKIAGEVLYNGYYKDGIKKNGYSNSGSVYIGDSASVAIDFRILCSQDLDVGDRFNKEMVKYIDTLSRTWWTGGGKPTLSIVDNKDNTFTLSGKLGADGTKNALEKVQLFYTTNGNSPAGGSWYTTMLVSDDLDIKKDGSYTKTIDTPVDCSGTVYAITYCYFERERTPTHSGTQDATVYYYPAPGNPDVEVIDNKNNTFSIKCTLGKSGGTTNPLGSSTLYFTTNGKYPDTNLTASSGSTNVYSLGNTSEAVITRGPFGISGQTTVTAVVGCWFSGTGAVTADNTKTTIKYRYGPIPGKPTLTYGSHRHTVREPVTFSWAAPTEDTRNYLPLSCLLGYRIRLYKDGEELKIAPRDEGTWYDTFDNNNPLVDGVTYSDRTLTVIPENLGYTADSTIGLAVHAAYRDGANTFLWCGSKDGISADSDTYSFENAGIVHVRVNTGTTANPVHEWVEGQVFVRVNNEWKEAETVNVKTSSGWKESI